LVAIVPVSIQEKKSKLHQFLKTLNPEYISLPKNSFKESNTSIETAILILKK